MTSTLRRLLILLAAVLVLAACSDDGSTVTPAEAVASAAPSAGSGVPPSPASVCSTPSAESTNDPNQAASATTGTGILQGHLYGVGGPAPGLHEAWAGTVTITGPTVHREITVGPDGAYAVALPAGQYDIVGRSPHFGGCAYPCYAPGHDHRVLAGNTTTLNTYCGMD